MLAQQITVTGNVKDANGESIIGASVIVVNNPTIGTVTDVDGNFSLSLPADTKQLEISYIGFMSQRLNVTPGAKLQVVMREDAEQLDEVVVIGYGTMKRRDLTGAVASVDNEALTANPVSNIAQALQGYLPGVSVSSQDGRPDATVSIRIRGGGSITQSNDPLFVVDGFPVSDINDIPADQVETIDVLKDAASTAVYGARGANGVILVTTKSGKEGKIQVNYNGYLQTKSVTKFNEGLDAQDYVYTNWAFAAALGSTFQKGMEGYFGLGSANGNNYAKYAGVKAMNWSEEALRSTFGQNHSLSVSGGGKNTKVMFNLNYVDDQGIQKMSGYTRYNASLKVQQNIAKNLKLDLDVRYYQVDVDGRFGNDWVSGAYDYRPILDPLGNGDFSAFGNGGPNVDPDQDIIKNMEATIRTRQRHGFRGMGSITWDIIKGLTLKSDLVLGRSYNDNKDFYSGYIGARTASLSFSNRWNFRSATTVNYQLPLPEAHSASVMVGQEVMESKTASTLSMGGQGYPMTFTKEQAWAMINNTDKTNDSWGNSVGTPNKTLSFFGRANYSYKGKYLATLTLRADGSSKFSPNHRWGYFPAAAVAWRLSDEAFMESTQKWLSNFKVRLSYGEAGSDGIDANLWKETWTTENINIDGNTLVGYRPGDMRANPDLKWETTVSRNLGFDFGLFDSKLHGSLDIYWNSTKDLLLRVPIDSSTGYSYQYQNVGETSNKGVELQLSYTPIRTKDFSLTVSGTYNYNKNTVEALSDKVKTTYRTGWGSTMKAPYDDYELVVGKPVGQIRGYIFDGFYSVDDFTYAGGVYTLKEGIADYGADVIRAYPGRDNFKLPDGQMAFPGALKLKDVTGDDGKVTVADASIIGSIVPEHTGGFVINATYKDFDFSAGMAYQFGGNVYNATAMNSLVGGKDDGLGKNRLDVMKDAYRIYDVNSAGDLEAVTAPDALRALNANAKYPLPFYENAVVLSNWLESSDFLRLNTLTVGYTLPKAWTKKWGCQRLRVYATAGNLFTITGYSGMDPETSTSPSTDGYPTPGYDYNTYPRAKTFTFGLNLSF
jgi:TonB-linked SusC/RagA family outer membrane protein